MNHFQRWVQQWLESLETKECAQVEVTDRPHAEKGQRAAKRTLSRRRFLHVLGAGSLTTAAVLSGCGAVGAGGWDASNAANEDGALGGDGRTGGNDSALFSGDGGGSGTDGGAGIPAIDQAAPTDTRMATFALG